MILRMVMNKNLFCRTNLLFDRNNPCPPSNASVYIGEVNSGRWIKRNYNSIVQFTKPRSHTFLSIDSLNIDKYGKLIVEVVLAWRLWFNGKARNRGSTRWVQGFVQDQKYFGIKKYISNTIRLNIIMV